MKNDDLRPLTRPPTRSRWLHFVLAGIIGLGSGIGPSTASAAGTASTFATRSGQRAALSQAAAAIRQSAPAATPQAAPAAARQAAPVALSQATSAAVTQAAPATPTDQTKVPHYYGPFPNWANSPLTLPDIAVTITDPLGEGSGAKASATVGTNGIVTGITIDKPGTGYTSADVAITGAGTGAAATATVTTSGSVTSVTVVDTGTPTQVGNALIDRQAATDTAANVFVVVPTPLPTGLLTGFQALSQAGGGSVGKTFNAYVLRPDPNATDTYGVVYDSGVLTVPALTNSAVSETVTYPVSPGLQVQDGDVLAFYGQGIPLTIGVAGDTLIYPANVMPAENGTVTLGSADFPLFGQDRTYSFGAEVTVFGGGGYGGGYTAPQVTFTGGGGTGTLTQIGNPLSERPNATDTASNVFVVVPTALPNGLLTGFQTLNQAAGIAAGESAGKTFHAYVLRPTGTDTYSVVYDSGLLTVPALADPLVSETVSFPVPSIAVQTGDVIGFYGQGIPLTIGEAGDTLVYPANVVPAQNGTVVVGSAEYPLYSQARTYSIAAEVIDTSGVVPLTNATASVFGGVDAVTLTDGGTGYSFPTVDFDLPDAPNGVKAVAHAVCDGVDNLACDGRGVITDIVIDKQGSGYSVPPGVVIRDGTVYDPINHDPGTFTEATGTATLRVQTVVVTDGGAGYTTPPTVTFSDASGTGTGATGTAAIDAGAIADITLTNPGSGYITAGGIKKFQDGLPLLCNPAISGDCAAKANNLGQYLPLAVPDTTTFTRANGFEDDADYYVIALVQHREQMNSSLPAEGTLLREYVQLETPANFSSSRHIALSTDLPDGTSVPVYLPDGTRAIAIDEPHYLGPVIAAQKDKPVRIVFYNLLPTGDDGNLYIPTDSSMMGSGLGPLNNSTVPNDLGLVTDEVRNPECTDTTKGTDPNCFRDNRATLHLHGGTTPWISDGTPHQWITPAGEGTSYPQGASVGNVPDMVGFTSTGLSLADLGVPDCSAEDDGCQTFYYTNQQSARLMFYHDHAFGITRLNVYLGEAAGYLISDATEQSLVSSGTIPADEIPLIIQDRTFVPDVTQLSEQDPTWDYSRWGGLGDFWYHHVYMPAQNPGDPSGMSAFGRWMYGPWFWPPADPPHGPIANPYYDMDPAGPDGTLGTADDWTTPLAVPCNLDDPTTWQYQTDPFCEPPLIPGTPNISAGMEQFNDTPLVNGTAYPTLTVEPKAYRLRILNAANDRFFNLQMYEADPSSALDPAIGGTEVALNPAELAAAQLDPNVFPTPDTSVSPPGPSWIVIGSEGGFLPAPVVVPNQPITWITDPTRFDVGNVDLHSLLVAPAERSDVIVDFSQYAGKTLILYNDAPAAFPARVASYDYYTGAPDLSPVGAPTILPGYGPNTRTIMQIKVASSAPAPAFSLTKLRTAFQHKANGSGVFESGQHPIIVGQAGYNSAYGTSFAASSYCNGGNATQLCDGMLRIADQGGTLFGFNTLLAQTSKMAIEIQPKAIHDEMNAAAFDEFGRMTANIGLEVVPATPVGQNIVLYPYINPPTEIIDATNLPKNQPGVKMTPISVADDGTQIWKITHNGVDTHPLHFHLYDVQLLNRVTWDNIIIPPDPTELGWKDTVRTSPLEDTIVALRPLIPSLPFELPNSVRLMNPAMPDGATMGFNNVDAAGIPTNPIQNGLVNFGWEYVWHCHILSHEEMDMMRPQVVAVPPIAPEVISATLGVDTVQLTWNDNSINETAFVIQGDDGAGGWTDLSTITSPLDVPNIHEVRNATIPVNAASTQYRVVAQNTVGYGGEFMGLTVQSESLPVTPTGAPVAQISTLALDFVPQTVSTTSAPQTVTISNTGTADLAITIDTTAMGVFAQSATTCGATVAPAASCDISVTFTPTAPGAASGTINIGTNDPANASLTVALTGTGVDAAVPIAGVAPASLDFGVVPVGTPSTLSVTVSNTGGADLTVSSATASAGDFTPTNNCTAAVPPTTGTCTIDVTFTPTAPGVQTADLTIVTNDTVTGPLTVTLTGEGQALPTLATPTNLAAVYQTRNGGRVRVTFTDNAPNTATETGFVLERADNGGAFTLLANLPPRNNTGNVGYNDTTVVAGNSYAYRVMAVNATTGAQSAWSNTATVSLAAPAAPAAVTVSCTRNSPRSGNARCTLSWDNTDAAATGFRIQRANNAGFAPVAQTVTQNLGTTTVQTYTYTTGNVSRNTAWYFRVQSFNAIGASAYVDASPSPFPAPIN